MLQGVLTVPPERRGRMIIEPDRAAAIGLAVAAAGKGDIVLVAGKGHERGQYAAGQVTPFDDREVAADALAEVLAARGGQARVTRTVVAGTEAAGTRPGSGWGRTRDPALPRGHRPSSPGPSWRGRPRARRPIRPRWSPAR